MANVDPSIFITLPDRIGLSEKRCRFEELRVALEGEAKRATAISIVGGYFGAGFLSRLCGCVPRRPGWRARFPLRIAVGIAPDVAQAEAWRTLRGLKAGLVEAGFRRAEVKAIHGAPHVHTKLFLFMRGTQPSYYVGSFNPADGGRHDMMVRIARRHDALAEYVRSALAAATDVAEAAPDDLSTLRGFFMSGSIAYRPASPQLLTFDAYRFTPDERAQLDAGGGGRIGVRHASPKTEGYGFRLGSAIAQGSTRAADRDDGGVAARLRSRSSSVETVLGFWVPGPYAKELRRLVVDAQDRRRDAFMRLGERLRQPGAAARAFEAYADYLADMDAMVRARGLNLRPRPDRGIAFAKFLDSRARILGHPERCARLARVLVLTPTPNLWKDQESARDFEGSFFDDLAWRLSAPGRRGRVLRSLIAGLPSDVDLSDPDALRNALVDRLNKRPWSASEWVTMGS